LDSVLIVSHTEKSIAYFTETLNAASINQITVLPTCGEARRLLLERAFDLVIINAPLRDETGERFSRDIASKGVSQVILVVANEHYDAISAICENDGVLTISKPINKAVFWSTLKLARAAQNRLARMHTENNKLRQTIADNKTINRAKCMLIALFNMGESEAHHYIEKQAMDMRISKRAVAEGILKTYEN